MSFTVLYDACVLYPAPIRDLLMEIAVSDLVAAIKAGAQIIVTSNVRDFPFDVLKPYGIEALHPDQFIEYQLGLSEAVVIICAKKFREFSALI